MLAFEGHLYKIDRNRDEMTYWKCTGWAVTVGDATR